jgi:hypothetical protein
MSQPWMRPGFSGSRLSFARFEIDFAFASTAPADFS